MSFFKNLFKLPGPRELGMSDYDALESRDLTPDCTGPTWEDWHEKVKSMYPVRYWLLESAPSWFKEHIWWKISMPMSKFYYKLKCHLVPSYRYHFLDLRQPRNEDDIDHYRYGWRDVPEKMLYAIFNLLGEYLNKENPHDLTDSYSREEIEADAGFKAQQDAIDEARAIYAWWTTERKLDYKKYNGLLSYWSVIRKSNREEADLIFKQMKNQEEYIESKTDEMIARLMKIRRTLWT